MADLYLIIASILREEDIEGLIIIGAPEDEYDVEASQISQAISKLDTANYTPDNIAAVTALVWAELFNRSAEEIEQRAPAFRRVAQRIIEATR